MQASILDLEGLESKRDRKMILREEKLKKEKKRIYTSKKGKKIRIVKKSNSKYQFEENRYVEENYSRSFVRQQSNRFGNELKVYKKKEV